MRAALAACVSLLIVSLTFVPSAARAADPGSLCAYVSDSKTGAPIADVSAGDPRGFSLGLGKAILGSIGAHWYYQGETLGYRTLYVWFEKENLMITVQTNSQPAADADKLHDLVGTIYQIVGAQAK